MRKRLHITSFDNLKPHRIFDIRQEAPLLCRYVLYRPGLRSVNAVNARGCPPAHGNVIPRSSHEWKGRWPLGIKSGNIPIIQQRVTCCDLSSFLNQADRNTEGEVKSEPGAQKRKTGERESERGWQTELRPVFIRARGKRSTLFLHQKHSGECFLCWFLFYGNWMINHSCTTGTDI